VLAARRKSHCGPVTPGCWCPVDLESVGVAMKDSFNGGVTMVNVHSGQADQHAVIDFYGSRVIPQLHAASDR
jgi:hypothetical protein